MTTDPIAALRALLDAAEAVPDGAHPCNMEPDCERCDLCWGISDARRAIAAYRWRDKPDKPGWWWMRREGENDQIVWAFGPKGAYFNTMSDLHGEMWHAANFPDSEWAPVLPPPREGE